MELLASGSNMPTVYLTRIVEFKAGHRIRRADWTAEANTEHFGRAAAVHSHDYQCRVTVAGPLTPEAGGVMNLSALDAILDREITQRLGGTQIHEAVPEFAEGRWLATGEALAVYLWERIAPQLPRRVRLHTVRVQEGPHLYSEYSGPEA
jgi:6-pyruvoyl-tetrahydropterin synthase